MPMEIMTTASPFVLLLAVLFWLGMRAKWKMKRESRMTEGPNQLENLLPLAAYDSDETGYWKRMGVFAGVFFGVGMTAFSLVAPASFGRHLDLPFELLLGAMAGLAFGLLFPLGMRRQQRIAVARLYAGQPSMIDPPPPGHPARYQLPCAWLRGGAIAGGVLYFGRGGLLFVPHNRNRKGQTTFEIGQAGGVEVALVDPAPGNALQRLLVPHPLKQVAISSNGVSARLLVPSPASTAEAIRRCLSELGLAADERG